MASECNDALRAFDQCQSKCTRYLELPRSWLLSLKFACLSVCLCQALFLNCDPPATSTFGPLGQLSILADDFVPPKLQNEIGLAGDSSYQYLQLSCSSCDQIKSNAICNMQYAICNMQPFNLDDSSRGNNCRAINGNRCPVDFLSPGVRAPLGLLGLSANRSPLGAIALFAQLIVKISCEKRHMVCRNCAAAMAGFFLFSTFDVVPTIGLEHASQTNRAYCAPSELQNESPFFAG